MMHEGRQHGPLPAFALCALLVAAQIVAAFHDVEHDVSGPASKVCATCVTAAQLGAACVEAAAVIDLERPGGRLDVSCNSGFRTTHVFAVRQRGPPAPLSV